MCKFSWFTITVNIVNKTYHGKSFSNTGSVSQPEWEVHKGTGPAVIKYILLHHSSSGLPTPQLVLATLTQVMQKPLE